MNVYPRRHYMVKCFFVISVFILLYTQARCQPNAAEMRFRKSATDTTDIYCNSPLRPFRYGYPYNKAQCVAHFNYLCHAVGFKERDTIAEVGAASGWIEGILSVLCDSLTLYTEDIDTDFLSQAQFDSVRLHFNKVRNSPQSNTMNYIIGSRTHTMLPDKTFDKILINNAFHEIKRPGKILADIQTKLKPDGVLIISDFFSSPNIKRNALGCGIHVRKVSQVVRIAAKAGFYYYDRKAPAFAQSNILFFSTHPQPTNSGLNVIADAFDNDIQSMETTYKDSSEIDSLSQKILAELHRLNEVYPLLEDYLIDLTNYHSEGRRYDFAYSIATLTLKVYAEDEENCEAYAQACENMGYTNRAFAYYKKAASLSDQPKDYDDDIKRVKDSLTKAQ